MLDQSDSLHCYLLIACYFRFVFVPRNCFFLNPCFIFPENLMLSFTDNVTTGTKSLALLIWNVALVVYIAALGWKGGLAPRLATIIDVIDISDIIHSFDHHKTSSISQLINDKSRDFQKLLKYLKATTASTSKVLLSARVFPLFFLIFK